MKLGTGSEFIPAKDINEANQYARDILGIGADYSGVDVRVANGWNARLKEEFERFPELKSCIRFVGEVHAGRAFR